MAPVNSVSVGSMCGRPLDGSEMASMSKNMAPGMCASRYSSWPLRPVAGMCQDASTMTRLGAPRWAASHSVETKRLSSGMADSEGNDAQAQASRTRRFCWPFFSILLTCTAPISSRLRTWVPPQG